MLLYLGRRLILSIPTALLVSTIVFSLVHLIPGNPALVILGLKATPSQVKLLDAQLRLNEPLWKQYLEWLGSLIRGNLGTSIVYHEPVTTLILNSLPRTIELTLVAALLAICIGIPSGLWAGFHPGGTWDRIALGLSAMGVVMPGFLIALLLIYFLSFRMHVMQITGIAYTGTSPWIDPLSYFYPALTLAVGLAAPLARVVRSEVMHSSARDYTRTIRSVGTSETRILIRWVLKDSIIPAITFLGTQIGLLFGGVVIIENIFSIPGMGNLLVTAIFNKDYPVVQGVVITMGFIVIIVNLIVDVVNMWVDPRIVRTRR